MRWPERKTVVGMLAAALLAGTTVYLVEQREVDRLNAEARLLIAERQKLLTAYDASLSTLRSKDEALAGSHDQTVELARLRNEVAQLRREYSNSRSPAKESVAASAVAANQALVEFATGKYISKERLAFAGYATPEATLQSMTWALMMGDYDKANSGLSPDNLAGELNELQNDPDKRNKYETMRKAIEPLFKGLQLVARKVIGDERVELKFRADYERLPDGSTPPKFNIQTFAKFGNEWKLDGSTHDYSSEWDASGDVEVLAP